MKVDNYIEKNKKIKVRKKGLKKLLVKNVANLCIEFVV